MSKTSWPIGDKPLRAGDALACLCLALFVRFRAANGQGVQVGRRNFRDTCRMLQEAR